MAARMRSRSVAISDFFIWNVDQIARQHGWCGSETVFLSQHVFHVARPPRAASTNRKPRPTYFGAGVPEARRTPIRLPLALHDPHRAPSDDAAPPRRPSLTSATTRSRISKDRVIRP